MAHSPVFTPPADRTVNTGDLFNPFPEETNSEAETPTPSFTPGSSAPASVPVEEAPVPSAPSSENEQDGKPVSAAKPKKNSGPSIPNRPLKQLVVQEKYPQTTSLSIYLTKDHNKKLKRMGLELDMKLTQMARATLLDFADRTYQCLDPKCGCQFTLNTLNLASEEDRSRKPTRCPICGNEKIAHGTF